MSKSASQKKLFSDSFNIALINELTGIGTGFIDGLVVSIFLGTDAIAASGLIHPFFTVVGVFSALLLSGTQKYCVLHLCKGEKEKAEHIFNTSLFISLGVGILLMLLILFFSSPIVSFLGAKGTNASLALPAKQYLMGLSFGSPALILLPIVSIVAHLEGENKSLRLSIIATAVFDVVLDVAAALSGFGMLAMGLATSVSQWIGLIILVFPVLKNPMLSIKLRYTTLNGIVPVMSEGLPKVLRRVGNIIKPITINVIILSIAGSKAMAAMSIKNTICNFVACFGASLGSAMFVISTLYSSEQDYNALKGLKKNAWYITFGPVLAVSLALLVFSKPIVRIFSKDSEEVVYFASIAVKWLSAELLTLSIFEGIVGYWQGIGKTRQASILIVLQKNN